MFSLIRRKRPLRAIPALEAALARIDQNDPSEEQLLFFGIFGSAHSFWDNMNRIVELPAKFKCDGVCFEVASYMLFRADFQAFRLDPSLRLEIMPKLHEQSDAIFRDALGFTPEAYAEISNNRLEILGHIVKNTGAIGNIIEALLLRFIYDTVAHNGVPQYGLDHHKPLSLDRNSDHITNLLQIWHPTAVNCIHESVDACRGE